MIFSPATIDDVGHRIRRIIWNEPLAPDALEGLNQILIMLKKHETMNNNSF